MNIDPRAALRDYLIERPRTFAEIQAFARGLGLECRQAKHLLQQMKRAGEIQRVPSKWSVA